MPINSTSVVLYIQIRSNYLRYLPTTHYLNHWNIFLRNPQKSKVLTIRILKWIINTEQNLYKAIINKFCQRMSNTISSSRYAKRYCVWNLVIVLYNPTSRVLQTGLTLEYKDIHVVQCKKSPRKGDNYNLECFTPYTACDFEGSNKD